MSDELERLRAFAKAIIQVAWDGMSLDGSEIQDMAEAHGLVERVDFDPKIHKGPGTEYMEPGFDWFVLKI